MIWIFGLSMSIAFFTSVASYDPDRDLTTLQIIHRHGYSAEAHTVLTDDGYILTLHRITGSPKRQRSPIISSDTLSPNVLPVSEVDASLLADKTKSEGPEILSHPNTVSQIKSQPIFLQHGLVGSSADWILGGPGNALAYLLADEGYDVWLGNARGNVYSRAHATLSTSDSKYWDFRCDLWVLKCHISDLDKVYKKEGTLRLYKNYKICSDHFQASDFKNPRLYSQGWHEMGFYDLPATIDYTLNETGYSSLIYIGFSMGTTMFYVMGTTRPEYNDKVLTMFSFAPGAFVGHLKGPLRLLAFFFDQIAFFLRLTRADVNLPQRQVFQRFAKNACLLGAIPKIICRNSIYAISGGDAGQFNMTLLSIILGHVPAGASLKTLLHYAQEIRSGKFQQYDHGSKRRNRAAYDQSMPPEYDLSLLRVPIELHYAKDDSLSRTMDVDELYFKLKNKTGKYLVNIPGFGHFDFLWGESAKAWVYDPVISRIKLLSPVLRDKVVVKRATEGVEEIFNDAKLMTQTNITKSEGKVEKEIPLREKAKTVSKQLEKAAKDSSIPDKLKGIWNKIYEKVMALPVQENIDKMKAKVDEKKKELESKKKTSEDKKDK